MNTSVVVSKTSETGPTTQTVSPVKENGRRVLTQAQWLEEGTRRFGPDPKQWKFVCPACGTVQTIQQLKDLGLSSEEIHGVMAFSCIGRFTRQGDEGIAAHGRGEKWNKGCNWTLGGLLQIHELEVVLEDGHRRMAFEFAGTDGKEAA
ncbi:MAG TPA: VVA0879 family protein [Candidatus Saccharimonadales bacterium]|nr:VVA0879 family protein [Candidatus Saccharimonadales bacterium]